ncbi:pirin family protein [Flavobacterium sp. CFS9]|uniref:Pirin family protein n=1 Tax=Flavobacterium sp. CFS9 TaxID=3143118 RepID=A0AAT9GXZ3_9FLAO
MNRKIEKTLTPETFVWVGDGFYTSSFIGTEISRRRMSPFFAVGYSPDYEFEPGDHQRGIGPHPHKGFETVTIAYKGKIAHRDSRGNQGIIGTGDAQWMTAGAGILHEEFHEKEFSQQGGTFQMVQMWVNLPAKDKETTPHYQDLAFDKMTRVTLENNAGFINVIAGEYEGQKGTATTYSPIHLYNTYLNKDGYADFRFSNQFNTALLVIEGSIKVNDTETLATDSFAMFENDGAENFTIQALENNTIVLVMSGEPLNEPIAHYGPFLMNTQEQLTKAFEEYKSGKFGTL